MPCLLGHKWNGCICIACGKNRDEGHDWGGCKCLKCGKIREEGHDLIREGSFTVCAVCGEKTACAQADAPDTVGPVLQDGLTVRPKLRFDFETNSLHPSGADVYFADAKVLSVNEMGRQLLDMADGTVTIDEMAQELDMKRTSAEIGMFFVTLGQSGYLKNRIEIMLYDGDTPAE